MGIFDRIADQLGDLMVPDDVRLHADRGAALLERGDFEEAVIELRAALALRADHPRAAFLLGVALARLGDPDSAEAALVLATTARPDYPEALVALGEARRRLGEHEAAGDAFRRALEAGPSDTQLRGEAHRGLGVVHLQLGRHDKAVRELRKAAALLRGDLDVQGLLGRALAARGDLDTARACLERAASAATPEPTALLALGALYRRLGRPADAEMAYLRALEAPALRVSPDARPANEVDSSQCEAASSERAGGASAGIGAAPEPAGAAREGTGASPDRAGSSPEPAGAAPSGEGVSSRGGGASPSSGADSPSSTAPDGRPAPRRRAPLSPALVARLGIAEARLDAGDVPSAVENARRAVDEAARAMGRTPADAHVVLGRALARAADADAALAAFDAALDELADAPFSLSEAEGRTVDRATVLDEAMHAALAAGRDERAAAYATQLLRLRPGDADATAARALAALHAGDLAAAEALLAAVPRATVETELAVGRLRLAAATPAGSASGSGGGATSRAGATSAAHASGVTVGVAAAPSSAGGAMTGSGTVTVAAALAAAAASLRRAVELAPADPRPRARLAEVYRSGAESLPTDLYGFLRAARQRLVRIPELADLGAEASGVVEMLDRPLMVTVMGEFNAGKSTFVNALVGEEVAPMGIVPTTATINVLKYGAERGARVIYRDDRVRDVAWEEVPALLRGLQPEEARRIRLVEVRYPLATLERVNVVDTPGLNSILPEHEETAREFIAEADAVLWLFTVGQAGAASEHEALERVRDAKKKVLGVLNKIDRVDAAELAEIVAHVERHFGDVMEALVPLSAREALYGRDDPARLERSNRAALDRTLEERFFAQKKAIKRDVALRRMDALVAEAEARAAAAAEEPERRRAGIDVALAAVREERSGFQRRFVLAERQELHRELDALLAAGAREVLDFVRPRRSAFGSNEAAPADRDFLVTLVEEKLGALGEASRGRVAAEASRVVDAARRADPAASVVDELRLLDVEVYGRYRAFVRGYLRGGRVDDFFTRVLPKLELSEPAIRRSLELGVLSVDLLDAELLAPLRTWSSRFFDGLEARLVRLSDAESLRRFELHERLAHPVALLRAALAALTPPPGGAP